MNIETWRDFNNLSVKIDLENKKYNAILLKKNNYLILRIDMTNNIDLWRTSAEKYSLLTGSIIYENNNITFLDCHCISRNDSFSETTIKLTVDYRVDRIILGKKLKSKNDKKINYYEVEYDGIDCLTNNRPYTIDYDTFECKSNFNKYDINLNGKRISVLFTCSEQMEINAFAVKRKSMVTFNHKKNTTITDVLNNIYMFRNFLMILLKKGITVKSQCIFMRGKSYRLFDCSDDTTFEIETNLKKQLDFKCLKIEDIGNISEVCQNFFDRYDEFFPLIELYYNVTQYKVPNLLRFVNAATMLEYCSRTFDYDNALKTTKIYSRKKNDLEYRSMVISLISNVNTVFGFTKNEIEQVSKNIKNARDKYFHYLNKESTKQLSYDEQFWYSYFIQDLVLLNVYRIIKLGIEKYEYITFEGFYYEKKYLL